MCEKCLGFSTNWSCKCGQRFNQHETVMKFIATQQKSRTKSNKSKSKSRVNSELKSFAAESEDEDDSK